NEGNGDDNVTINALTGTGAYTIAGGTGNDRYTLGQITGTNLMINGGVNTDPNNPNTNTLVSAASGSVTLGANRYTTTTPAPGAMVTFSNIQVASLSATSINSTGFAGSVVSLTGAPAWQSVGPQGTTNGQIQGMPAQGNPVANEVLAVAIN